MNENNVITKKKIIVNSLVFLAVLSLTFYIVFSKISFSQMMTSINLVKTGYVIAGLLCMGIFALGEGLNIRRPLNMFGDDVTVMQGVKYAVIGFFFSSVTPSASGGQPMQLYYMHADGIKVSHGSLALLFELLSFETVVTVFSIVGYITQHRLLVESMGNTRYLLLVGIVVSVLVALFIIMAIFSRNAIAVICRLITATVGIFSKKKAEVLKEHSIRMIVEYRNSAVYFKENKMIFVKTLVTSAVQLLAMFSVTYLVYKGFGLSEYSAIEIILLQAVLFTAVAFLPLPGAVGASEGAFVLVFRIIFPHGLLAPAMVLSRCLSFYICVIISGISVSFFTRLILVRRINGQNNNDTINSNGSGD